MERSCKKSAISRAKFEVIVVVFIFTLFQLGCLFLNYANASEGVAVDKEKNIYVTDRAVGSVYKYANNGSLIAIWTNIHSPTNRIGFIFNASLGEPTDIVANVYVLDLTLGVQKFNSNGTLLAI